MGGGERKFQVYEDDKDHSMVTQGAQNRVASRHDR